MLLIPILLFVAKFITSNTSLEDLEKELEPTQFFRAISQYIIAHTALKDIVLYSNSRLKLTPKSYQKEEVIVSRERVGEFKEWLG